MAAVSSQERRKAGWRRGVGEHSLSSPDTFTDAEAKMAAPPPPLLLLLLMMISVGASSEAQGNAYSQLSPSLKRGVDLALEKLHSHATIQQHLVFLRSLSTSDIQVGSRSSAQEPPGATGCRLSCSLASAWRSSTTTSTSKPPLVPKGRRTSRVAATGTTG